MSKIGLFVLQIIIVQKFTALKLYCFFLLSLRAAVAQETEREEDSKHGHHFKGLPPPLEILTFCLTRVK